MKKVAETIRSINETQRICTHEFSGHLHLLRFCIDEMFENLKTDSILVKKCDEVVSKLEEMNKLWKICSRFHDREIDMTIDTISEKSIALTHLYFGKFIKEIDYRVLGEGHFDSDRGLILIESLFAVTSLCAQLAVEENVSKLFFEIDGTEARKISVKAIGQSFSVDKARLLLSSGDENEKSQRRFTGAYLVNEFSGSFNILENKDNFCVEICL